MVDIPITNEDIDELEAERNALFNDPYKQWRFDGRRRHVISSWNDIQACPGSGKTTLVAAKLLILAKKWIEPHKGICVLTHTNVARDEIISRLHDHPAGFKLTSYPHFIGTIQEFVNRFLGMPYCRSVGFPVSRIDDDSCVQAIEKNIRVGTKAYLDRKHASLYDLKFNVSDGGLNVPGFANESTSNSYKNLENAKTEIVKNGLFFFSEMYSFGNTLLKENPDIIHTLCGRFPIVMADEMQDTQKYQDTLLNKIFRHDSVSVQRLGDPDQAIFDGIGGDEPNESYNENLDLYEIKTTHRFGLDICEKIKGLSYNKLDALSSDRVPNRGDCAHAIFIYVDESREDVLDAYGDLVAQSDPEENWETVKAVGGVEGSGEVGHISKYWPKFDRDKSSTSPKPKKFIHIAHFCRDQTSGHSSANYNLLLQGVVDLLRKANLKTTNKAGRDVYFTRQSIIAWIREKNKFENFRKAMTSLVLEVDLSADGWARHVTTLKAALELNALTAEANEYLEHDVAPETEGDDHAPSTNFYTCANGRKIEVGTIHSVKGETHDSTLILETKLHQDDVREMLPHIIDATKGRPATDRKKAFMRKLYVAASRPRHLLCIAVYKNNINDAQITQLEALGWRVELIPSANENDEQA